MRMHSADQTAISELDSRHFGLTIARTAHLTSQGLHAADAYCRRSRVALHIARCPTPDISTLQAAQAEGFRVMDTLVYLRRGLATVPPAATREDLLVRKLGPADAPAAAAIAQAAFQTYDGHYHADPRLPASRCTDVYVSWASRVCTDTEAAEVTLGAEWQGALAGFLAIKDAGSRTGDVVLAAVAPHAQGRGIFTALLAEALRDLRAHSFQFAEYSCVVSNKAALKALGRLGFEIDRSSYTLHKWFAL